jgi:hypothetical protein
MVRRVKTTQLVNQAFTNTKTGHTKQEQDDSGTDTTIKQNTPILIGNTRTTAENLSKMFTVPNSTLKLPNLKGTHVPLEINPDDLIDMYVKEIYENKKGANKMIRGQVVQRVNDTDFRVSFDNGSQKVYHYETLVAKLNKQDEDDSERWSFNNILKHRTGTTRNNRAGKIDLLIEWEGGFPPTWEPMEVIKKDDPITLARYAQEKHLLHQPKWRWANTILNPKKRDPLTQARQLLLKRKKTKPKYQFGIRVPRSLAEAYKLDEINGNHKWRDAIKTEVNLLYKQYKCFTVHPNNEPIPENYRRIPLLWTFAVKFDGRHRARCVAGGHVTPDWEDDLYSGVVNLETIRIAFVIAALNNYKVIAADVSSAYIQANTIEKVYVVAGPEFGPLQGKKLIVTKALYGLKTSGAQWHQKFADNLRDMGFRPCQADYDFWIRSRGDSYDYIAVMVDDLLIFSKDPDSIINPLKKIYNYELKGVGEPDYYSGADMSYNPKGKFWEMSAKTYIKNTIARIEKLLDTVLKAYNSPLEAGDHPELDDTDLLYGEDISIYQMLIGCAQWAVTLGRYDIQYATNTLARYASVPREGHRKRILRVFGYLKVHTKAKIRFDPSPPNYEGISFLQNDWIDLYPDAQEAIPDNAPPPHGPWPLSLTIYVDASHADCQMTRRSVTGYLIVLGKTPIRWYSKRQNTVESATYGSELVALRIASEAAIDIRYKLRMMGISFEKTTTILCDNQSVVINTQLPSSSLKKKHNSVAFHKCRECVAAGIIRIGHINTENNFSDILTKPKGPAEHYSLTREPLFGHCHPDQLSLQDAHEKDTGQTVQESSIEQAKSISK